MGNEIKHSADNRVHYITSKSYNGIQHSGNSLDITIRGTVSGGSTATATAVLKNMGDDGFTVPPLPNIKQ